MPHRERVPRSRTSLAGALTLSVGLISGGELYAQTIEPGRLAEWINPIKELCLASEGTIIEGKGDLGLDPGFLAKVRSFFEVSLSFGYEKRELRGTLEEILTEISHMEHNAIRNCMQGYIQNLHDTIFEKAKQPRVVVMDGHGIAYPPHKPLNNRQVLQSVLPELGGRPQLHVVQLDIYSGWYHPQWIVDEEPDLVVFHWSAFEKAKLDQEKDVVICNAAINNNDCAGLIVDLIKQIWLDSPENRKPGFLIYSRSSIICSESFIGGLRKLFGRSLQFGNNVGLVSMSMQTRQENFKSPRARRDLRAMVRHLLGRPNLFGDPDRLRLNSAQGLCLLGAP